MLARSVVADIDIPLPPACALESGPVDDYPLLDEETVWVEKAVPKRRRQFASGRHFARLAVRRLGGSATPIGRGPQGRPLWPAGLIGSISHSQHLAAAVVSNGGLRGIGIDIEQIGRLDRHRHHLDLKRKVLTPSERLRTWADPREGGLIFSAKEAAYKAINPLIGLFIGFQEVEVEVDWRGQSFAILYRGEEEANRLLEQGFGRFSFCDDHMVTLFFIE